MGAHHELFNPLSVRRQVAAAELRNVGLAAAQRIAAQSAARDAVLAPLLPHLEPASARTAVRVLREAIAAEAAIAPADVHAWVLWVHIIQKTSHVGAHQ